MRLFSFCVGFFRRPTRLLLLCGLIFVFLGTFYWSLWEIPWLRDSAALQSEDDDAWIVTRIAPLRATLPDCVKESFPIVPKNRYCSWNTTLQDCYETLMPTFHKQQSWVFLGDTGMANIPYFLSLQWPVGNLTIQTRRNPCQNLIYYGLPPPYDGWKQPNPDLGEGPTGLGKERPYCMDCTNCWNVKMESGENNDLSVEYLVMEYARDVSIPSRVTKTTQETALFYMSHNPPSVCIAHAGLHDAAIPQITQELYLHNVDKYLGLLQRTCDYVIWISLHAVVESDDVTQSNCKLQQWKNAFMGLVDMRNYANVYVVDIWDKSFHTDFQTPTCLGKKFYASLARLFRSLMAGPDLTDPQWSHAVIAKEPIVQVDKHTLPRPDWGAERNTCNRIQGTSIAQNCTIDDHWILYTCSTRNPLYIAWRYGAKTGKAIVWFLATK